MEKPSSITDNDWKLLKAKYKNIKKVVRKLEKYYPVQYLIGNVDFYGYKINVNKHVLIPRFETETLVEKTIDYIKKLDLCDKSVIDIGTGSGCISIVLKKELEDLNITSLDISKKAIKIAKKNAKQNNADITFIRENIFKYKPINKYEILISNPPYIKEGENVSPEIKYEPKNAIYSTKDELKYYKHILSTCSNYLTEKNLIAFEIGAKQGKELKKIAKTYFKKGKIIIEKDLTGKDRYLFIINE